MKEILILSGKGGTGKTSITAALASLNPNGQVLADCDVDAADLHLILDPNVREEHVFVSGKLAHIDPDTCTQCGLCREHCQYGAINEDFQVMPEHCEGCSVCAFVCPVQAATMSERECGSWFVSDTRFGPMVHAALGIGEENSGKLVTTVKQAARKLAEQTGATRILVDGSPGIGCPVIASLANTDEVLLVAEPTISALHDLKRVIGLVRHFKIPAMVLINKSDINPGLTREIRSFCSGENIPVVGEIPYLPIITSAQIAGQSIVEYDPDGLGATMAAIREKMEEALG